MSFGIENSKEDVDTLIKMLDKIVRKTQTIPHTEIKHKMNDFTMTAAKRVYTQL